MDTVRLWQEYCRNPRSRRAATIRRDLTRYNAEDVAMLIRIADKSRELMAEAMMASS
jgi:hypothetical protein